MGDSVATLQARTAVLAANGKPPVVRADADIARIRRTAIEFEAYFLAQALQPMFAGIGAEEPFGGGFAEDMWRSMQVEQYGKALAKSGGIGIADAVVREMLRAQEQTEGRTP
jgi:Rod binding domain-containing protein